MRRSLAVIALVLLASSARAAPGDGNWEIRIASWNLLNFGLRKAGLPPYGPLRANLIARYAQKMSQYDIIFVQELLNDGTSLTNAVANDPQMAAYDCHTISQPSGRVGRQERYGLCYATARLVLNNTFDWMNAAAANAFNGTQQLPQNVWMRPPLRASFTYTPADGEPYTFEVTTSHTKPAFGAGGPPPGTPGNAANNDSVYYELWGMEHNPSAAANVVILGDLNADCASYPAARRGANFTLANGWTWYVDYGEKTNTALGSDCAYDRFILNPALNQKYRDYGVDRPGINVMVDGKRVSDHYLVWLEIGNRQRKRPTLVAAVDVPVDQKRQRIFAPRVKPILINATGVLPSLVTAPKLFVVAYDQNRRFAGNRKWPLTDVRGAATPITITSTGTFAANVAWQQPVTGAYTLVLDANGDGFYVKSDGDVANSDDEIDFLVSDPTLAHSDVVTIGDNAQLRELFNAAGAQNIYAAARGLASFVDVDVYVASTALLPASFAGWEAEKAKGTLDLPAVSVPVNVRRAPVMLPTLGKADKVRTVPTSADGRLFANVWSQPSTLFDAAVLNATPPSPDYKPSYATDCPDDDSDVSCDPCQFAYASTDANFRAVCNVWPSFTDTYGTSFNVVVDTNRNGRLDNGDLVDTHDIGDITTWLASHASLDASANGNPAVGEYKEYLDSKLNLTTPLPPGNTYDAATQQASQRYMCSPGVPATRIAVLRSGSQVGFQILDADAYTRQKQFGSGVQQYDVAHLDDVSVAAASQVCMNATNAITVDGIHAPAAAQTTIQSQGTVNVTGDVRGAKDGLFCITAAEGIVLTTISGNLTLAAPNPITAGATVLLGIFTGGATIGCALGY
jgi:hypothetical protein